MVVYIGLRQKIRQDKCFIDPIVSASWLIVNLADFIYDVFYDKLLIPLKVWTFCGLLEMLY